MSGGSLNYFYSSLEDHVGDFGDKELDDLIEDLVELFHAREWFLSCDTGEGDWRESRDSFKKKWFTEAGRKDRIERYFEDLKNETMESLGLSTRRCEYCQSWKEEPPSKYGECPEIKCRTHRSESCRRFKGRGEGNGQ